VLSGGLPDVATLILFLAAWGMARKSSASCEGNVVGIEHGLARVIGVREKLAEGYESDTYTLLRIGDVPEVEIEFPPSTETPVVPW
jgi:hypothetical protein